MTHQDSDPINEQTHLWIQLMMFTGKRGDGDRSLETCLWRYIHVLSVSPSVPPVPVTGICSLTITQERESGPRLKPLKRRTTASPPSGCFCQECYHRNKQLSKQHRFLSSVDKTEDWETQNLLRVSKHAAICYLPRPAVLGFSILSIPTAKATLCVLRVRNF